MGDQHGCAAKLRRVGIGPKEHVQNGGPPPPEPWPIRYANVALIAVSIVWTCIVYLWRICYPMLTQKPYALGSRAAGIVLLVFFCILWGMGTYFC